MAAPKTITIENFGEQDNIAVTYDQKKGWIVHLIDKDGVKFEKGTLDSNTTLVLKGPGGTGEKGGHVDLSGVRTGAGNLPFITRVQFETDKPVMVTGSVLVAKDSTSKPIIPTTLDDITRLRETKTRDPKTKTETTVISSPETTLVSKPEKMEKPAPFKDPKKPTDEEKKKLEKWRDYEQQFSNLGSYSVHLPAGSSGILLKDPNFVPTRLQPTHFPHIVATEKGTPEAAMPTFIDLKNSDAKSTQVLFTLKEDSKKADEKKEFTSLRDQAALERKKTLGDKVKSEITPPVGYDRDALDELRKIDPRKKLDDPITIPESIKKEGDAPAQPLAPTKAAAMDLIIAKKTTDEMARLLLPPAQGGREVYFKGRPDFAKDFVAAQRTAATIISKDGKTVDQNKVAEFHKQLDSLITQAQKNHEELVKNKAPAAGIIGAKDVLDRIKKIKSDAEDTPGLKVPKAKGDGQGRLENKLSDDAIARTQDEGQKIGDLVGRASNPPDEKWLKDVVAKMPKNSREEGLG